MDYGNFLSPCLIVKLALLYKNVLDHSELTLAVSVWMAEIILDFEDVVGNKNLALSD